MKKKFIIGLLLVLTYVSSFGYATYFAVDSVAPFKFRVSRRTILNSDVMDKFGNVDNVNTADGATDLWEFGGLYTFSPVVTLNPFLGLDNITRVSSSNALDTQTITVLGLDKDGYEVEQEITLTGTTPVVLPTPLWRVYRMENKADFGNNINGTVYCYTSDATVTLGVPSPNNTVRAIMTSNNSTLMGIYTIPRGYTGYLVKARVSMSRSQGGNATFRYLSARTGKVFVTRYRGEVAANKAFVDERAFPDPIPELTDIVIRCDSVSNNGTGLSTTFQILLVKNN